MNFGRPALDKLEELRRAFDRAMILSSGYRCPEYNARISRTGRNGPHTRTDGAQIAVDVLVYGFPAFLLLDVALDRGWTGIGVRQDGPPESRFLHLDRLRHEGDSPRPWVWSYSS